MSRSIVVAALVLAAAGVASLLPHDASAGPMADKLRERAHIPTPSTGSSVR